MDFCVYHLIHLFLKDRIDHKKQIKRKDVLLYLKYFHIEKKYKNIVISELIELGLLKKVNRDLLEYVQSKKTDKLENNSSYRVSALLKYSKK